MKYTCPVCRQQVEYAALPEIIKALGKDADMLRVFICVQASCGHQTTIRQLYLQAAEDATQQSNRRQG